MNVIHTAKDLAAAGRRVCLSIGVFDGVHLGHQQIIRKTVADARQREGLALVVTFDRHPSTIVAPAHVPPMIYSQPQKIRAIETLDADALLVIRFDEEFSRQTGEQFVRALANDIGRIESVCVGADFVFGQKRSGNVALLKQLGGEMGFQVHGLAAVALDGETVSSTRIREAIRSGDFDAAGQMLGRAYSIAGRVAHGDQLGQKLGFPTANLDTKGLLLPANGVYAAHATVRKQIHRAVLNIGHRPTLQNPAPEMRVEVHLLDFSGDLYGEEMEITFASRLRDEQKFASLEELKSQITKDIEAARHAF
ncbi:MAG: bifunctional riboflavin kinase/FAD synthetase [Verrucomicrobia bacterium]|nr:bifunctional riboflavin kinase/FAD synthetase [Verrucomicrobiota bacterium]